ncbi:MAG: glycosyltransferase [Brevundimonas sp.]|uniref:TIGR04282 family arsenosugar biosynthesis glycosyltransferase n=1 Tax=Brevundimonas sp. TaxID=1871086 RepID=UPI002732FE0A|nr:TIGR04282 family arsenosugar biosynthesis glycosyltransferase [Brevundimonas sp.]MDP3406233.1 glycosyltransferase [Brevundimonas sp.]
MIARPRHLVIFARRPRLGVGKRRLAADVGDVEALRFARGALDQLIRTLAPDPRWHLWLAVAPDRPLDWVPAGTALPQGPGDLGQRLTRVIRHLPPGPVVVLGSDTPTVTRADVAAAFRALGPHRAVFGPAPDGGYWLIGLRRGPGERLPFAGVRWSTPDTLSDTLARLEGSPVAMLRLQEDVDDGPALKRYRAGGAPNLRGQSDASLETRSGSH